MEYVKEVKDILDTMADLKKIKFELSDNNNLLDVVKLRINVNALSKEDRIRLRTDLNEAINDIVSVYIRILHTKVKEEVNK